jgi:endonuclease-3
MSEIVYMLPLSERIPLIMRILQQRYRTKGMVDMGKAEDTLFATVLSAQSTDVQVLKAYPGFRKRFSTLKSLSEAPLQDIEQSIATIGLFRAKARSLKGIAEKLRLEHDGVVPRTMDELLTLPGVGRKTASCVLWYAYGIPAMAVDTHVARITQRLGWAKGKTPEQIEEQLKEAVPRRYWGDVNRTMVQFGREYCRAQKPQCATCPLASYCPYPSKPKRS